MDQPKTPLCDRWSENYSRALAILDFLAWLDGDPSEHNEKGAFDTPAFVAKYDQPDDNWATRIRDSHGDLVFRFFGIDPQEIDKERRAILASISQENNSSRITD